MESIGEKLTSARESLGYTVEQIARDTNIAKSYLNALENEDFSVFPGETYLYGFLRNYSEYLGLEPEDMVTLYKNMQLQEQPAPMEELLVKRRSFTGVAVLIIFLVLAGLGAAGYFWLYPTFIAGDSERPQRVEEEAPEVKQPEKEIVVKNVYEFADEVVERRFKAGDAISVKLKDDSYRMVIASAGDTLGLILPSGEIEVPAGEETMVDLNGDTTADIRMLVRTIDSANSSAVIHIDRFVQATVQLANRTDSAAPAADTAPADTGITAVSAGEAGSPSRVREPAVIREASRPEPFNINVVFRGYCLMRYSSDNSVREERYFHKGETFRLDVNSTVTLWVSNAGSFSGKVNGVDINIGDQGEVSAGTIRWIYNSEKAVYELTLTPVY